MHWGSASVESKEKMSTGSVTVPDSCCTRNDFELYLTSSALVLLVGLGAKDQGIPSHPTDNAWLSLGQELGGWQRRSGSGLE